MRITKRNNAKMQKIYDKILSEWEKIGHWDERVILWKRVKQCQE